MRLDPLQILQATLITLCASFFIFLILNSEVWSRAGITTHLGTALYELQKAQETAAYVSRLLRSPAATEIPVPVMGVSRESVADTFGDPRGVDRTHEGTDIFAPRGTYIVSATEGVVLRIGENRLGGKVVFVLGPGGERYYYAHLDHIDPLLMPNQRVGTSTILGTVGTTGNATGTPPHLHFGIYGEGGSRNPFERLR